MLIVHCPNKQCAKRYDFINPPQTFTKLCGCGSFWIFDRGDVSIRCPLFVHTQPKNGSTTVPAVPA